MVVVEKRKVFPPLLCAIVLGVIPWRRFVSFRRAVYRFEPKSKRVFSGFWNSWRPIALCYHVA